jgi:putative exporter of polyketide antibiotics
VNIAPPALFVLGVAILTYGWWPRFATTAVYGLVTWSFIIELGGLHLTGVAQVRTAPGAIR